MAQQFPGFSSAARAAVSLVVLAVVSLAWAAPCAAASEPEVSPAPLHDVPGSKAQKPAPAPRHGPQLDVALASGVGTGGASKQLASVSQLAGPVVGSMLALGYRW